jgi:hypothetical protein
MPVRFSASRPVTRSCACRTKDWLRLVASISVSKTPSFHRLLAWPASTRKLSSPISAQAWRSRKTALFDPAAPPPKSPSSRVSSVPQPVRVRVSMPKRLNRAVIAKSPPLLVGRAVAQRNGLGRRRIRLVARPQIVIAGQLGEAVQPHLRLRARHAEGDARQVGAQRLLGREVAAHRVGRVEPPRSARSAMPRRRGWRQGPAAPRVLRPPPPAPRRRPRALPPGPSPGQPGRGRAPGPAPAVAVPARPPPPGARRSRPVPPAGRGGGASHRAAVAARRSSRHPPPSSGQARRQAASRSQRPTRAGGPPARWPGRATMPPRAPPVASSAYASPASRLSRRYGRPSCDNNMIVVPAAVPCVPFAPLGRLAQGRDR